MTAVKPIKRFFSLFLLVLLVSQIFQFTLVPLGNIQVFVGAQNYVIDGDVVYVNDSRVYIAAYPHTIYDSQYVNLNVTSKVFSGQVDFCLGVDSDYMRPKKFDIYDPRNQTQSVNLSEYFVDEALYMVNFTYETLDLPWAYNGEVWVWVNVTVPASNGTNSTDPSHDQEPPHDEYWYWGQHSHYHYEVANWNTKIIYWNELVLWRNIIPRLDINKVNYEFQGMDRWYYANHSVTENVTYHTRVWLEVIPTLGSVGGKYFVAFKRQIDTIQEAIQGDRFYYLDPWWDSDWGYRKAVNITGSTAGSSTNYSVCFKIYRSTGTDGTETAGNLTKMKMYAGTNCENDFDDIRFVNASNNATLSFWRESYNNTNWGEFWVRIPSLTQSANTTIYVYYGNSGVQYPLSGESTTSHGQDVFMVFDDFEDGTAGSAPSGYSLRGGDEGTPNDWIEVNATYDIGDETNEYGSQSAQVHEDGDGSSQWIRNGWEENLTDCVFHAWRYIDDPDGSGQSRTLIYTAGATATTTYIGRASDNDWRTHNGSWVTIFSGTGCSDDVWYRCETYMRDSDNQVGYHLDRNDFEWHAAYAGNSWSTSDKLYSFRFLVPPNTGALDNYYDNCYIRKWIDPEPTLGGWGSEEIGGQDLTFILYETLTLFSSLAIGKSLSFVESATLTMTATLEAGRALGFALAETFQFLADLTANRALGFSLSETFSFSEALSRSVELAWTLTETFSFSDLLDPTVGLAFALGETFSLTDSLAAARGLGFALTETFSLLSSLVVNRALGFVLAETFTILDSVQMSQELAFVLAETLTLIATMESVIEVAGAQAYAFVLFETFTLVSEVVATRALAFTLFEDFTMLASLTPNRALGFVLPEVFTVTSTMELAFSVTLILSETFQMVATLIYSTQTGGVAYAFTLFETFGAQVQAATETVLPYATMGFVLAAMIVALFIFAIPLAILLVKRR